jgi:AcrR family transcriptional regulator
VITNWLLLFGWLLCRLPLHLPRRSAARDSRADVFAAAAELFSSRGFDGVGVDDIAHAAGLNKAMIYYHFESKHALYREVVQEMLRAVGTIAIEAADRPEPADIRLSAFIAGLIQMAAQRPWFPPLMLREISGAPTPRPRHPRSHETVFVAFTRILADGQQTGLFRPSTGARHMSILGPVS